MDVPVHNSLESDVTPPSLDSRSFDGENRLSFTPMNVSDLLLASDASQPASYVSLNFYCLSVFYLPPSFFKEFKDNLFEHLLFVEFDCSEVHTHAGLQVHGLLSDLQILTALENHAPSLPYHVSRLRRLLLYLLESGVNKVLLHFALYLNYPFQS